MSVTLVLGAQWGDEGKGKIVDVLAEQSDIVARYQGGANAGHTVVVDGHEFILHLLPTGILHPKVTCVIGGGVVIDPKALLTKIDELEKNGIKIEGRLYISHLAHLIMPYHRILDQKTKNSMGKRRLELLEGESVPRMWIRWHGLGFGSWICSTAMGFARN